jgi:hypothetical protein
MTPVQTGMQKIRALAKKMRVEIASNHTEIAIYSPKGYRFAGTGTHVCVHEHHGVILWKLEAIKETLEDLKEGLERCPKNCACKW